MYEWPTWVSACLNYTVTALLFSAVDGVTHHLSAGLCCNFEDYTNFTEGESRYCAGKSRNFLLCVCVIG